MTQVSIFDRAKGYKRVATHRMMPKVPVVVEVEISTQSNQWLVDMINHRDADLHQTMIDLATYLCDNMPTSKFAFVSSNKLWIVLTDTERPETQPLMGGVVSRIISLAASLAAVELNELLFEQFDVPEDSNPVQVSVQVYNVPYGELSVFFGAQQTTFITSSLHVYARYQTDIEPNVLSSVSNADLRDILKRDHGIEWYVDSDPWVRSGTVVVHNVAHNDDGNLWRSQLAPVFQKDRKYIANAIQHRVAYNRLVRSLNDAESESDE